jgi:hypothetical protein
MLTAMDDLDDTRRRLDLQLGELVRDDAIGGLKVIGQVLDDLDEHQRSAVRAAALGHSWAEIGEALGVSRQAAHRKFAKDWAEVMKGELKAEVGAYKTAVRRGDEAAAATAASARDELIAELRTVGKAQKRRRRA